MTPLNRAEKICKKLKSWGWKDFIATQISEACDEIEVIMWEKGRQRGFRLGVEESAKIVKYYFGPTTLSTMTDEIEQKIHALQYPSEVK